MLVFLFFLLCVSSSGQYVQLFYVFFALCLLLWPVCSFLYVFMFLFFCFVSSPLASMFNFSCLFFIFLLCVSSFSMPVCNSSFLLCSSLSFPRYVLNLMDTYGAGFAVIWIALWEVVALMWIYGVCNFSKVNHCSE